MPVAIPQKVPQGAAAIVATANNDMAGHGDEQFKDASAQQPASGAFDEGLGIIRLGGTTEDKSPNYPEGDEREYHCEHCAIAGDDRSGPLASPPLEQGKEVEIIKGLVGEDGAEGRKKFRQRPEFASGKKAVTMTGIFRSGRRVGRRRSAMLMVAAEEQQKLSADENGEP